MILAGVVSALVLVLVAPFVLLRRMIDPACPLCAGKQWTDVPRGIVCRDCGWSNLPVAREETREAIAA